MAYREVTMVEVKEVLRQWLGGEPKKRVAKRLSLSPRTVRRYCELAERHGMRVQDGPSSLTDERLTLVIAELTTMPGRPHGVSWALCHAHRDFIARHVEGRVRLSKVRKLLLRQGIDVPYPTLHRFAVEELGFGRTARRFRWPTASPAGAADRHGLDAVVRARRARPTAAVARVDLHAARVALPLRLPVLRGDHADRDRGVRGRVGVLRRRLPGPGPRQHQGDRREEPIRSARGSSTAFLEYAQARGFHVDPARAKRPKDKARVERSVPNRPRRLLRRRSARDARASDRARPLLVRERVRQRRHTRTQRGPREHFETEEAPVLLPAPAEPYDVPHWREPKVARDQFAQVLGALYSLPTKYIGQTLRARADSRTVRFYDRRVLVEDASAQAPGWPLDRPSDFPDHVGHIRAARSGLGRGAGAQARPERRQPSPKSCWIARCRGRACAACTRSWPGQEVRRRARRASVRGRARRRHARRQAADTHARARHHASGARARAT